MTPARIARLRSRLGLSQSGAASLFRSKLRTWQDWEAGKRKPTGPTSLLLELVDEKPELAEWVRDRAR